MKYKQVSAFFLRRFKIPKEGEFRRVVRSFTIAEKVVFYFFVGIFVFSGLTLLFKVSNAFMRGVPVTGGSMVEGVVGNPRFINPILAISEADKNLSALIYSGLVHFNPDGSVENDLAEGIETSEDGLLYTVTINPTARFHDGTPITADDVIYTIQRVTDPLTKSPRRGNWDGVSVEKVDDMTVSFSLKKPYSPFIENLALGIIPKHIWKNVTEEEFSFSQFNTLPLGSGPYKISRVERNEGGIPNYYELEPFKNVVGRKPYVKRLVFKFYPSELSLVSAFKKGEVESLAGMSPEIANELKKDGANILSSPLPRVFGVFFNPNKSKALLEHDVRQALDLSAPKEEIVDDVLSGYAVAIDGPLPPGIFSWSGKRRTEMSYEERFELASSTLAKAGWKKDPETGVLEKKSGKSTIELSFSISTGDATELQAVAEKLKAAWTRLGARVEVIVFETGDLNQNIIRPREFEALLFGEVVGRDADIYPFWHSSQRNDPGLNIALYTNARADKLLETARGTTDPETRGENYEAFEEEVQSDVPAVFLYSPNFLYAVPEKVKAVNLGVLGTPQDRFLGIRNWYIETDKVWELFVN